MKKEIFKIKLHRETVYILSNIILALSVAFGAEANIGISMIVAPAYILNESVSFLTFGQSEYVIEALLFILLCIAMKKIKPVYFSAFLTGIIYGFVLDLWQMIPIFNTSVTPPESLPMAVRIVFFILSVVLASFAVALSFHTYLYPQVKDFFVKAVCVKYKLNLKKFKTLYDVSYLVISVALSFIIFGKLIGISIGTVVIALCNGSIIGFFDKFFTEHLELTDFFKRGKEIFQM